MHAHVCRLQKRKLFRQRRLKHSGVGGATALRRVYRTRAFTTLAVLVVNMRVRKMQITFLAVFQSIISHFMIKKKTNWI